MRLLHVIHQARWAAQRARLATNSHRGVHGEVRLAGCLPPSPSSARLTNENLSTGGFPWSSSEVSAASLTALRVPIGCQVNGARCLVTM